MNKNTIFYIVAANLTLLVLLVFIYPQPMIEPGELIDAHESLEADCFACHTPFIGSRPAKCVQCHKPAEIGLVTTKGLPIANEQKLAPFHQDLIEQDCVACHSDHKGVQPFRPIDRFSHELLQVDLREDCNGCHRTPGDSLHREIVGRCGDCHSLQAWTPATIDHDRFFVLDRNHQTTCKTCHMDNDASRYSCYGCHEHSRANIRDEHMEEGIYDYEDCVECHRSGESEEHEHEGRRWDSARLPGQGGRTLWKTQGHEGFEHDDDDDDD